MPRRFTKKQREWLEHYQATTGFDALGADDPELTFEEIARKSIQWFEDWSSESLDQISAYPGRLEAFDATEAQP